MPSLLALARAASEEAKWLFTLVVWLHSGSLLVAIVALNVPQPWEHVCAVIALLVELAAWVVRYLANNAHSSAERGRRSAMLMWAFGSSEETLDAIDLRASFTRRVEERAAALEDPHYYASTLPPGEPRFIDMLQESAFWSKHLYRLAGWLSLGCFVAALVAAVLVFMALEPAATHDFLSTLARFMVPIAGFFISIDLLGQGLAWLEASAMADRVDRTLANRSGLSQLDLLATFAEYSATTASAAPIPTFLHRREHDHLDREWHRRSH